jgi:hypothetical protein
MLARLDILIPSAPSSSVLVYLLAGSRAYRDGRREGNYASAQ